MKWSDFKKKLLNDEEYKKELYKSDLKFEISEMLIEARTIKGLTQYELASRAGTQQPSIARVENGSILPSLAFLEKIAKALNTHLIAPKFAFMKDFNASATTQDLEIDPIEKYISYDEGYVKSVALPKGINWINEPSANLASFIFSDSTLENTPRLVN